MPNADFYRVLLVEDDPADASLVRQALRHSKRPQFEVVGAGSLAEAFECLETHPDIVLLDLSLPDSLGIETVLACRRVARKLPLIVLTGNDDTDFAIKSLDAGAQDYLVKGSFDTDSLIRAIRYALIRTRLEARNDLLLASLEAVGNGLMITDREARIEWVNSAFERISGYTRAELLGRKPSEMLKSGAQDDAHYATLWETILSGQTWHGEMINRRKDGRLHNEEITISPVNDANGQISNFVSVMQDISERKKAEERIRHLAQYDALTDLPNRSLFSDRLHQALALAKRDNKRFALIYLDLDRFKPINDTLGHDVGDLLLKEAAARMQIDMRQSDTVARMGGDEFVVLLPEIETIADAQVVAEKIRCALNQPFLIKEHTLFISSSSGIAIYPDHGTNDIELSKNADSAMYQAKAHGRNRVELFNPA